MSDLDRLADDYNDMRRQRDEALDRLNEREADMHARIRAGYDATIADAWRAKVAEVEAERDKAQAAVIDAAVVHADLVRQRDEWARQCAMASEAQADALNAAARWRRLLGYVTSCPTCGAEPGCDIDCETCMEWP